MPSWHIYVKYISCARGALRGNKEKNRKRDPRQIPVSGNSALSLSEPSHESTTVTQSFLSHTRYSVTSNLFKMFIRNEALANVCFTYTCLQLYLVQLVDCSHTYVALRAIRAFFFWLYYSIKSMNKHIRAIKSNTYTHRCLKKISI